VLLKIIACDVFTREVCHCVARTPHVVDLEFPWSYDSSETCYFLEGDVAVTPDGGEPVEMGKGDLVTFPTGMSCTWNIREDVRKHYKFG